MNLLTKKYAVDNNLLNAELFDLPERIVQFGTGVLLRGLPNYLIDKANKAGVFKGRAVVLKTTNSDASDFPKQDCLFTINEKGIDNQQVVNQSTVIASLSRLLNANEEWAEVLALVERPEVDIFISNTTEAGIQYIEESLFANPPKSFPAKLTALLYRKFQVLGQKAEAVIVPTELLVGNGDILRGMVVRHAERENLGADFLNWLQTDCRFCNSLVDRIVPGATPAAEKAERKAQLGYVDNLMIDSEPFLLWAIEGDAYVREKLSFAQTDSRMAIAENIEQFREQKLRLLNGGHSISVPLAHLKGLKTVKEMMNDPFLGAFTEGVILGEILPTLPFDASDFANSVLSRFKNPFVEHKLVSILAQKTAKMNARNAATFVRYYEQKGLLPPLMIKGFAAYILYTKNLAATDDQATFLASVWAGKEKLGKRNTKAVVKAIVSNESIFDSRLKGIPNFIEAVAEEVLALSKQI